MSLSLSVPTILQVAAGGALGASARYFFAAGLLAAGLSSAVTAPLAAAYAVCGAMGWPVHMSDARFRLTWIVVLATGTLFAALGTKPLLAILFAQAANGFLLPVCAVFLVYVMNQRALLGSHVNNRWQNALGGLVILVTLGLGLLKLLRVAGLAG